MVTIELMKTLFIFQCFKLCPCKSIHCALLTKKKGFFCAEKVRFGPSKFSNYTFLSTAAFFEVHMD